jgi:hypothetical protein
MRLLVEEDVVALALAFVMQEIAEVDDKVVLPRNNAAIGCLVIGVLNLVRDVV